MRLLDRYLLRELIGPLLYCLVGFLIFWVSFDLFEELDDLQESGLSALEVAEYYLVRSPEFLLVVIPVALLLALLYTVTQLSRHQELTAIRAAGVSLWRLSAPYFAVGLVFAGVIFALNEWWVPETARMSDRILSRHQGSEEGEDRWVTQLHFRNARDGRIWSIGAFHLDNHRMRKPQVEWNRADGRRQRLIAESAFRTNGIWVFFDVQRLSYENPQDPNYQAERLPALAVPEFGETPEQIASEVKISRLSRVKAAKGSQLSLQEVWDYLRLHPDLNPRDQALLRTQLQARLAAPWTCLVVVVVGLAFGAPSGRRNVFVGVAGSVVICFCFFILQRFGLALGTGGFVPAWLAAWFPNLLFGAWGAWQLQRVR